MHLVSRNEDQSAAGEIEEKITGEKLRVQERDVGEERSIYTAARWARMTWGGLARRYARLRGALNSAGAIACSHLQFVLLLIPLVL